MEPATVLARARSALEMTARTNLDLIRCLPALDRRVPGSEWTVREAAIHLVNHAAVHTEVAEGLPSPIPSVARAHLAAENAARIGDIPESDPDKVANLLGDAVAGLLDSTTHRSGDQRVVFHGGLAITLAELVCLSLGEQVLHGFDIAAAAGSPSPIDPYVAGLVLYGYAPYLSVLVDGESAPSPPVVYGVDLGDGRGFVVTHADGRYVVEPAGAVDGDGIVAADPAAFLLVLSGRMTQAQAMAVRRYALGGSRPDLAARFIDSIVHP